MKQKSTASKDFMAAMYIPQVNLGFRNRNWNSGFCFKNSELSALRWRFNEGYVGIFIRFWIPSPELYIPNSDSGIPHSDPGTLHSEFRSRNSTFQIPILECRIPNSDSRFQNSASEFWDWNFGMRIFGIRICIVSFLHTSPSN